MHDSWFSRVLWRGITIQFSKYCNNFRISTDSLVLRLELINAEKVRLLDKNWLYNELFVEDNLAVSPLLNLGRITVALYDTELSLLK